MKMQEYVVVVVSCCHGRRDSPTNLRLIALAPIYVTHGAPQKHYDRSGLAHFCCLYCNIRQATPLYVSLVSSTL